MKYRKRIDGSLTTKSRLIAENPDTSLPKTWTAATLDFLGVDPVLPTAKPTLGEFEVAVAAAPVLDEGNWVDAWTVQPMFVDNDESTAAEQEAAYTASLLATTRASVKITMRQCRLALLADGKLAAVDAAISALPEPDKTAAATEWEYAHEVHRASPFVALLGAAIGYTDVEVDALFEQAGAL
jgi:hypothetical protein